MLTHGLRRGPSMQTTLGQRILAVKRQRIASCATWGLRIVRHSKNFKRVLGHLEPSPPPPNDGHGGRFPTPK